MTERTNIEYRYEPVEQPEEQLQRLAKLIAQQMPEFLIYLPPVGENTKTHTNSILHP